MGESGRVALGRGARGTRGLGAQLGAWGSVAADLLRRGGVAAVALAGLGIGLGLTGGYAGAFAVSLLPGADSLEGVALLAPLVLSWALANALVGPLAAFALAAEKDETVPFRAALARARRTLRRTVAVLAVTLLPGGALSAIILSRMPHASDLAVDPLPAFVAGWCVFPVLLALGGALALGEVARRETGPFAAFAQAWRLGRGHRVLGGLVVLVAAVPGVAASASAFGSTSALGGMTQDLVAIAGAVVAVPATAFVLALACVAAHVVASGEDTEASS